MRDVVSPAQTKVLLALIRVHQRDGRATVRTVADEAGLCFSTVHTHMRALERARLVSWTPGRSGTLRPLVQPVVVL